jgi:cellulose synthase (UDP-forming)
VHLLDDGRRPAMRALAERLGVTYHIRGDNKHAKAGNINAALARTHDRPPGSLVAIFDCDHVPVRSFLRVTAGAFVADPRLALVQTPHYFYNPDPFERNLSLSAATPSENAIFYHAVQIGNDFWNSVLFCGSCALIRREALEEVGGIAVETVTEDAHTSLRMLARGWRSMYLDVPQAAGLATERYGIHVAQRIRWARGMTQILLLDSPLTKPGLTLPQRAAYLNAILHFQLGLFRIIFVLAPLSYLLLGLRPLSADPVAMIVFAVPHMALAVAGGEVTSRGMRHAFWSEVYEAALAPYTMLVTAMAWINPRHGTFNVTTKGATLDEVRFDWRGAAPNLLLLALCLGGLVAAPIRAVYAPEEMGAILLTSFFCLYNTVVMAAAVAVALDRPQQRRAHRVARAYPVQLTDPGTGALLRLGQSRDLTDAGVGVVLPGGAADDLPRAVQISLQVDGEWSAPMDATIVSRGVDGDKATLGLSLTPEAAEAHRRTLVEAMFSAPDSWRVDANPVRASVALLNLLQSPLRAAWSLRAGRGAR